MQFNLLAAISPQMTPSVAQMPSILFDHRSPLPGLSGVERSGQAILLNPANGLLSAQASPDSKRFYDWLLAADGGQAVIRGFGADRYGQPLYTLR